MNRIGVRELQQNASAAVRRASRGERIEVTDRGRPVAVLVPLTEGSVIDTLESAGRLVKAEGDLLDLGPPLRLPAGVERRSSHLARMRAAER